MQGPRVRSSRPAPLTAVVKHRDLLAEIERDAVDPDAELLTALRKCIQLGGETGSQRLRSWAVTELKGYGPDDTLPEYRELAGVLVLDGVADGIRVTGQSVQYPMLPEVARDHDWSSVSYASSIAEIADVVASHRAEGKSVVRLSPPGAAEVVALMNHDVAQGDPWRNQHIDRIYWNVSLSAFVRILDIVRTTLVELVAEMRAGTPPGARLPSHQIAERAFDVAIRGDRNRVVQHIYIGDGGTVTSSVGGAQEAAPESRSRRVLWWVTGIVALAGGVLTAVATFTDLLG